MAVGQLAVLTLVIGLLGGAAVTYVAAPSIIGPRTVTVQGPIITSTLSEGHTIFQTSMVTQMTTMMQTSTIQGPTMVMTTTESNSVPSSPTFVLVVDKHASQGPYQAVDQTGAVRYAGSDAGNVLQSAIDATSKLGGGTVAVAVGRFNTSVSLTLDQNVALVGLVPGPFDGVSPASHDFAPEFLITNTLQPFITMSENTAVEDLAFYYPNQVSPSGSAPSVYPATLHIVGPSTKVSGCTFINSYDAVFVEAGRVYLENLAIGAFHDGITLDHVYDFVHIDHVTGSIFWDTFAGINLPNQPVDAWVSAHGTGLVIYRADGPTISDYTLFSVGTGIKLADSPDTTLTYRNSYGVATNVDMEGVNYGLNVTSVRYPGWSFTNVQIGCVVNCITIKTSSQPNGQFWYNATAKILLKVDGGYFWYPDGQCPVCSTSITPVSITGYFIADIQDVTAYNPVGPLAAPAMPVSGATVMNMFPEPVRISVFGGVVSDVSIDGTSTGLTSGMFELQPGETITLAYTVAPSWDWAGL